MVDPVSVAGAAGGVIKLVYSCSTDLYTFINQSKVVDQNVQALYDEVKQLGETSEAVESTLRKPGLDAFQDAELWSKARDSIDACSKSLNRLKASFNNLHSAKQHTKNPFSKAYAQFRLDLNDSQITSMRRQMQSHRLALLTISSMINVHVASVAPALVMEVVVPRLEVLEKLISSLVESNTELEKQTTPTTQTLDEHESALLRTNHQLVEVAEQIVEEVNTVMQDDR